MAARQKTREIEYCNEEWERRKTIIQMKMTETL
jgi:hypothetical protein